jgi:hypothetical protein
MNVRNVKAASQRQIGSLNACLGRSYPQVSDLPRRAESVSSPQVRDKIGSTATADIQMVTD